MFLLRHSRIAYCSRRPAICLRAYATTPSKSLRDRQITASSVNFIDSDGKFHSAQPLSQVFRSYDPSSHSLVCLTPHQEVPTCRLYSLEDLKALETKAYTKSREKRKTASDPSKVLKECKLNWNVTEHDLAHKLDSGVSALKRGNKLDVSIGTRTSRNKAKTPLDVKRALVEKVRTACIEHGKEWKAREGDLQIGMILHLVGTPPKAETTSTPKTPLEKEA